MNSSPSEHIEQMRMAIDNEQSRLLQRAYTISNNYMEQYNRHIELKSKFQWSHIPRIHVKGTSISITWYKASPRKAGGGEYLVHWAQIARGKSSFYTDEHWAFPTDEERVALNETEAEFAQIREASKRLVRVQRAVTLYEKVLKA